MRALFRKTTLGRLKKSPQKRSGLTAQVKEIVT